MPRGVRKRKSAIPDSDGTGIYRCTNDGRILNELVLAARPLFLGPLRPHEYRAAREAADRLIEHAEHLMTPFLDGRLHLLGVKPGSTDEDDIRQHLRMETFLSIPRYDPAYSYSTYLVVARWRRALDDWKSRRHLIHLTSEYARTGKIARQSRTSEAREEAARLATRVTPILDPPPARSELDEDLYGNEFTQAVRDALAALPERTRDVVETRLFGIGSDRSLKTIGNRWGVSKERVRQIETVGLRQLRAMLDRFRPAVPA